MVIDNEVLTNSLLSILLKVTFFFLPELSLFSEILVPFLAEAGLESVHASNVNLATGLISGVSPPAHPSALRNILLF